MGSGVAIRVREVRMLFKFVALGVLIACTAACNGGKGGDSAATDDRAAGLDALAEEYVHLALAFDRHDEDYVDAYYGPPEWLQQAEREAASVGETAVGTVGRQSRPASKDAGPLPRMR